jgi:predicted nucleic acid-binding Zn ribbon protein
LTFVRASAINILVNDAATFDAMLDAGREPSTPCPVCTGDEDAEPCSEECDALVQSVRQANRIKRVYAAARRALIMAHVYREESKDNADPRTVACIERVNAYRTSIRLMRGIVRVRTTLARVA